MKTYQIQEREINGGIQKLYRFPNNYGASVVKHLSSYGHEQDQWELAVLIFKSNRDWNITYNTPITDDVLGYLSDKEVQFYLKQIKQL